MQERIKNRPADQTGEEQVAEAVFVQVRNLRGVQIPPPLVPGSGHIRAATLRSYRVSWVPEHVPAEGLSFLLTFPIFCRTSAVVDLCGRDWVLVGGFQWRSRRCFFNTLLFEDFARPGSTARLTADGFTLSAHHGRRSGMRREIRPDQATGGKVQITCAPTILCPPLCIQMGSSIISRAK